MGKRILFIALLAGLAAATLMFLKDFKTTASGSLYYLGKSIHNRDADLFFRYVDYERIIGDLRFAASGSALMAQLTAQAVSALEQQGENYLRRMIEDPNRPNLPNSLALLLGAQQGQEVDGRVEVLLPPLSLDSRSLRFTLARCPDSTWKAVDINREDLQWLLLSYLGLDLP